MGMPSEVYSSLSKSDYSCNFNILLYFGAWPLVSESKIKISLYKYFQFAMLAFAGTLDWSLFRDLYLVFGDMKKMSWNICVTTVFTGGIMKLVLVYRKSHIVNELRANLESSMKSRTDPEDVSINKSTVSNMKKTRRGFYAVAHLFGAIWQISRYMSKYTDEKLLPIPLTVPWNVDLDVGITFDLIFLLFGVIATAGLYFIVEQEMAMFSLLIQIKREYDIFLKDIPKLVKKVEIPDHESEVGETSCLNSTMKNLIKELYIRQQTIMRYTEMFENGYSKAMVVQILFCTILCISIGVQCIVLSTEYLSELAYQIAYLSIVLMDVYLLCLMGTKLNSQCEDVGKAFYDTAWYMMSPSVRKDLLLMILLSQRPPKITSMKAVVIDLVAFMTIMKNIYSWLALFRQFVLKSTV